jgi:hypothetical protein
LCVEASLKLKDQNINVFIDKLLNPGEGWEKQLEEAVRQSRYFICLIGPNTLDSVVVRREIAWAHESSERVVIPLWHNGYKRDQRYDELFGDIQAIPIHNESAEAYELAIIKLLNRLEYSTI